MGEIKWIKIATDVFSNRKILQIEALPEADTILVIWFKLLCLAGVVNDYGQVYLTKDIPYTEQMLATQFNRPLATVQMALNVFKSFGMIEITDDIMRVSNWEKYQNIDGMERVREQNRIRKQRQREREKLLLEDKMSRDNHGTVTEGHAIDKDIDKEKEKNIYNVAEVVAYLNEKAGTKYRASTESTKKHIIARFKDGFTIDDFKTVIDKKVTEWKGSEMEKYLRPETLFGSKFEGYLNQTVNKPKTTNTFNNFEGRKYDFDELERQLVGR